MEEWRDIEGHEGSYQVSNEGRVRSLKYGRVKQLKEGTKSIGYRFVVLCENAIKELACIHQLVAQAFIPNPNGYTVVHHKDHNPSNNSVENLEWISEEDHRKVHGIGNKNVYQYTLDGELVKIWESARSIEREIGFSQGHVSDCCRGRTQKYKGYRWSYNPL